MEQKLLIRSMIPSPLTRGQWVGTLACGHLHGVTLTEPQQIDEALEDWWAWFRDPNVRIITPIIRHIPAKMDCRNCDNPVDYSSFGFFKSEA